jgi:DNA-binding CsgD family transcriptional regulator
MKSKIFVLFCFFVMNVFSQTNVYYFKDINNEYSISTIENASFQLAEKSILDAHSDATFWFKIPAYNTNANFIFRIKNNRVINAKGYQSGKDLRLLPKERYVSFIFDRSEPVYIRVNSDYVSYFPISLKNENISNYEEKLQIFINGFYYGFAILIILYSFTYFYFFKDDAFLYYALFLFILTFSFFIIDGMLMFFGASQNVKNYLILLTYILLAFFSSKFINSFLLLEIYFPKLKKYGYSIGILILITALIYLSTENYLFYIILNGFIFALLLTYWLAAIFMFKKNIYTKIFVFAYALLLFSGIDFLLLKNLGFTLFDTNGANMKLGGFIQMIVISLAVLYREKTLKDANRTMKNDIIKYAQEINQINIISKDYDKKDILKSLSRREEEIFELIALGKSNKEISNSLNISINTVKFHVKNIYEKLDVKSRKEAIILDKSLQ